MRWKLWLGALALLLAVPLIAMQFTEEVNWGIEDFAAAAALLGGAGIAYEIAARMTGSFAWRATVAVVLALAVLTIWAELAVGIF